MKMEIISRYSKRGMRVSTKTMEEMKRKKRKEMKRKKNYKMKRNGTRKRSKINNSNILNNRSKTKRSTSGRRAIANKHYGETNANLFVREISVRTIPYPNSL